MALGGGELNEASTQRENTMIQITADSGVTKTVIRPGDLATLPEAGDEIVVHYRGLLPDGSEFDSSYKRQKPFKFTLGQGKVIKGWDLGVATMARGEKARLTCTPKYAYGKKGNLASNVPPNATLAYEVELLSFKNPRDITGDTGVLRTVVQQGLGPDCPQGIDDVLVKFAIRVQGEEQPILATSGYQEFSLAGGLPIRAFEIALPLMQWGEKVALTIKPEYGFQPGSLPTGVSSSAVLEATLELVSWIPVEEVTKDGLVTKRILRSGKAEVAGRLTPGNRVRVSYIGRLVDGTVFEEWTGKSARDMVVEEGEVVEGLDRAIGTMQPGEMSEVIIAPSYAFGAGPFKLPLAVIPPAADVIYTVELLEVIQGFNETALSLEEKLAEAEQRKATGNTFFADGAWFAALRRYESAQHLLKKDPALNLHQTTPAANKRRAAAIIKSCALNAAAASLKLQRWEEAKAACDEVFKGASNVKALFRRAQALLGLDMLLEAEAETRRALLEEPNNKDLRVLLTRIRAASAPHDGHVGKHYMAAMRNLARLESEKEEATKSEDAKYPRGCSPEELNVLDPEEVRKHEAMLDAAEFKMADEVKAMKAQMGLPTEPPPPDHRPGNPYRDREQQERELARQQRQQQQQQQRAHQNQRGRGYSRSPKFQSRFVPITSPPRGDELHGSLPGKMSKTLSKKPSEQPVPALVLEGSEFKEIPVEDDESEDPSASSEKGSSPGPEQAEHSQSSTQTLRGEARSGDEQPRAPDASFQHAKGGERSISNQAGTADVDADQKAELLSPESQGYAPHAPQQVIGQSRSAVQDEDAAVGSHALEDADISKMSHTAETHMPAGWEDPGDQGNPAAVRSVAWELKAQLEEAGGKDTLANQLKQAEAAVMASSENLAHASSSHPDISSPGEKEFLPPLTPAPGIDAFQNILSSLGPRNGSQESEIASLGGISARRDHAEKPLRNPEQPSEQPSELGDVTTAPESGAFHNILSSLGSRNGSQKSGTASLGGLPPGGGHSEKPLEKLGQASELAGVSEEAGCSEPLLKDTVANADFQNILAGLQPGKGRDEGACMGDWCMTGAVSKNSLDIADLLANLEEGKAGGDSTGVSSSKE